MKKRAWRSSPYNLGTIHQLLKETKLIEFNIKQKNYKVHQLLKTSLETTIRQHLKTQNNIRENHMEPNEFIPIFQSSTPNAFSKRKMHCSSFLWLSPPSFHCRFSLLSPLNFNTNFYDTHYYILYHVFLYPNKTFHIIPNLLNLFSFLFIFKVLFGGSKIINTHTPILKVYSSITCHSWHSLVSRTTLYKIHEDLS